MSQEKVALVTGVSSGIGQVISSVFIIVGREAKFIAWLRKFAPDSLFDKDLRKQFKLASARIGILRSNSRRGRTAAVWT